MGDSNTIYEAGQSLVEVLKRGMTPQPIASQELIGLCSPHEPEDFQLTVWIYNIETANENGINQGFSPDPENSEVERYAPMPMRFQALVTAHSKAPAQTRLSDEYRIIGRAIQLIYDTPQIEKEMLKGSLAAAGSPVKLQYMNLSSDELSKIWNNTGKAVKPSFGVQISSVSIGSNRVRPLGRRVANATVHLQQKP